MVKHVRFARRLLHGMVALILLAACSSGGGGIAQYSATGSWSGTVTEPGGVITHEAEALIAPDGTMHLMYVNTFTTPSGEATSRDQFVGNIYVVDNYDQSTFRHIRQFSQSTNNAFLKIAVLDASGIQGVIYEGSSKSKWSFRLTATPAASRPAMTESLYRAWSNTETRQLSDISVAPSLDFSGQIDDLAGCTLSGKLQQLSPNWNIYRLNFGASFCKSQDMIANYTGLAMLVDAPVGAGVPYDLRLFAATVPGESYVLDPLMFKVINQPPTSLAGPNQVKSPVNGRVAMDGRLSSDPNRDSLSYLWSGVGPGPEYLPITLSDPTSPTPNFVPTTGGQHVFTLTVSDGEFSHTSETTLLVQLIDDRFTLFPYPLADPAQSNGVVYDNLSNLVWLRDADCFGLLRSFPVDVNEVVAEDVVAALQGDGQCNLNDGSEPGDWRLPTRSELISLVDPVCALDPTCWQTGRTNPTYEAPALVNTKGDGHWQEGDAFYRVRSAIYWSGEFDAAADPECPDCNDFYVNFGNGFSGSTPDINFNYVWPVRDRRPDEAIPNPPVP